MESGNTLRAAGVCLISGEPWRKEWRRERRRGKKKEIYWIQFWLLVVHKNVFIYSSIQYKKLFHVILLPAFSMIQRFVFHLTLCKGCAVLQHICASLLRKTGCYSNVCKKRSSRGKSADVLQNCTSPLKCACSSNDFPNLMEVTAAVFRPNVTSQKSQWVPHWPITTLPENALPVTPSSPLHLSFLSPPKTHQNPP